MPGQNGQCDKAVTQDQVEAMLIKVMGIGRWPQARDLSEDRTLECELKNRKFKKEITRLHVATQEFKVFVL